jgi:Tfp pilus assembly protein PilF
MGDTSRMFSLAAALCLALAVFAVYGQAWDFEFLSYDDPLYVEKNPAIRKGLSLEGLVWAFTDSTGQTNYFAPVTWLSFLAAYELVGEDPGGHHLVNVVLHALNAVLLFFALRSLTGRDKESAFAAALFALHPVHAESVCWVAERKDMMLGLFFCLSLWAYSRYARHRTVKGYLVVLGLYLLGLLSKPSMVVFPGVLLLTDWWPLERFSRPLRLKGPLLEKIPFLAPALAVSLATMATQMPAMRTTAFAEISLGTRAASSLTAYLEYIRHTFWPAGLAVIYPYDFSPSLSKAALGFFVLAAVSAMAVLGARRFPWLATGWLWFLGALFPTIGILVIGPHYMADRYAYIPAIGLYLAAAYGAREVFGRHGAGTGSRWAAALALLGVLGVLSRAQAATWENNLTVYGRALAVTQNNWAAHVNMGNALQQEGKPGEAVPHYERALEIRPEEARISLNLAQALAAADDTPRAEALLRRTLDRSPDFPGAWLALARFLERENRAGESLDMLEQAALRFPDKAEVQNALGLALQGQGDSRGLGKFETAVRLDPAYAPARENLGVALMRAGKPGEALEQLVQAVSLDPALAGAHHALGTLLLAAGQEAPGRTHIAQARALGYREEESPPR